MTNTDREVPAAADDPDQEQIVRQFGWWDMFVKPEDDPRADGASENTERAVLVDFLRDQRLTLQLKCSGLDAEGMAKRSVPPSNLSLLGLVRHLAGMEQTWFQIRMAGQQVPRLYRSDDDPDADFNAAVGDPAAVAEAWESWRTAVAFAERFVDDADDLGMVGVEGDILREVVVHLIEEYARHNGHADLLRERIDGRVGQ